jgi:hypothetical protein
MDTPPTKTPSPRRGRTYRARRKGDDDELDPLKQIFVAAYIANGGAEIPAMDLAREQVGLQKLTRRSVRDIARRMVREPAVERLITLRRREAARKSQLTVNEYYASVRLLLEQSAGYIPVRESQVRLMDDESGDLAAQVVDVPVYRPSVAGQKAALELIARALELYGETHAITGPGGGPVQIQSLAAAILAARDRAKGEGPGPDADQELESGAE